MKSFIGDKDSQYKSTDIYQYLKNKCHEINVKENFLLYLIYFFKNTWRMFKDKENSYSAIKNEEKENKKKVNFC